ncbi:MAG TPA: HEAT repeat domain-containing protein, partial [Candidatus Dormibacteraeota bacterium]|nr:HEAT repeat domain-containing protein [Candidatus Dormibacteraeota bacterium]
MRRISITGNQITLVRIVAALLISAAISIATGCKSAPILSPKVVGLIEELKSPAFRRRCDAAVALERVHPLPLEAIEALAAAVKVEEGFERAEPNYGCQLFEFKALSMAGAPAIPAITALTKSENPLTSSRAVDALGSIGLHDPIAWPILIGALKGSSPHAAAQRLSEIGPPVLPLLRESLNENDPHVRAGVAEALREMAILSRYERGIGPPPGILIVDQKDLAASAPGLAAALKDPDGNARDQAAIALAWVAPTDNRSVPILVQVLEGKDSGLSQTAFSALQSMGSGAKDAFPTLERVLTSNPGALVREEAANLLASSGGAAACVPLAHALADDKNGDVRTAAIFAMARVRP